MFRMKDNVGGSTLTLLPLLTIAVSCKSCTSCCISSCLRVFV